MADSHRVTAPRIAKRILKDKSWRFARDRAGRLYHYSNGVYCSDGDDVIRRAVKETLTRMGEVDRWSRRIADEVVGFIGVDAPLLWERPPLNVVNVRNGLLDIQTYELAPHSPDHLTTVQIAASYDPLAECPEWETFADLVFPSDSTQLAWEIVALLLTPFTDLQKAILLFGKGGNGKSTFLMGLTNFLGKANVSSVSLQNLGKDRFAGAGLYGKLANICADLPSDHLHDTSVFKQITGGDLLTVEEKFRPSFQYSPYARLIFSANEPPLSPDGSSAYFERWIVIHFDCKLRGSKDEVKRSVVDARLSTPVELSGLLNKALAVASGVLEHGVGDTESTRTALASFVRMTDPLSYWLSEATFTAASAEISKGDLYNAHRAWCEKHGVATPTTQRFGHSLARLRREVGEYQKGPAKVWYYRGIGLRKFDVLLSA